MSRFRDWDADLGIDTKLSAAPSSEVENTIFSDLQQAAAKVEAADAALDAQLTDKQYISEDIAKIAETDLDMLAGLAMPTVFRYLFPPVLIAVWQMLRQLSGQLVSFPKLALGIPRGRAKTTVIKLFLLWLILFTKHTFILVLCDTGPKAENLISDLFDMLDEPNIISLFGNWRVSLDRDTRECKVFTFRGRNIIVAALGVGGSVRGLNLKNDRPSIMVFDDIQSKEASESNIQSAAIERWMYGTAMKSKSPHGCLYIFVANMYPTDFSILKKLKKNSHWIKFISGGILADGTSIWPQLYPINVVLDELKSDIASGHPEIFFSEVMNDTNVGINARVDFSLLAEWRWGEHEIPQGKFIIIDPSSDKKGSDDVAIGYFEIYDGLPGLRHVIEEQLSPGTTILKAMHLALTTGTKLIVVESVAYQYSLLYWFKQESERLGVTGLYFMDIYSGSFSKNSRITNTIKALTSKEMALHPSVKSKVTHQIVNWNPLKRDNVDNVLDLLSYAPRVLELYPELCLTEIDPDFIEAGQARVQANNTSF